MIFEPSSDTQRNHNQILWGAKSISSSHGEAPKITGKRNPFPCHTVLAEGPVWQQGCAGTQIQGDRNRNLPFCSDVTQFSRLDLARANRPGQASGRVCNPGEFPVTGDKEKPGPTEQNCPESREEPRHPLLELKYAWAEKILPVYPTAPWQIPATPLQNRCTEPKIRNIHMPSPYSLRKKQLLNSKNPQVFP